MQFNDSPLFEAFCASCRSLNISQDFQSNHSTHHKAFVCQDCGHKFTKKVTLKQEKVADPSILRILQRQHLEPWERTFLKILVYQRRYSQAEQLVLEHINAKVNPVPSGRGVG